MTDKEVLRYYDSALEECRETMKPLRTVWDEMQARYMCKKDYSKKKPWQFKVYSPYTKPKTKRAVSIIKATLLKAADYFDFDTPVRSTMDPNYQHDLMRCNYTKRLVKAHLDSRTCSFVDHFCEALEAALGFTGVMVLKFWTGYEEIRQLDIVRSELVKTEKLVLKCKAIDPYNFDFTQDRSIQIEHEYVTLPELWDLVGKGIDEKRLKKLVGSDYGKTMSDEERTRLASLGLGEASNEYRKRVMLSHYWGPLIDKDNKVAEDHVHFIVGNEKFLLTDILDNPYPDKSTPYVFDSILKVPFRFIGKALCEDVAGIETAINDIVMLQLDNLLWGQLGINEIDSMAVDIESKDKLRNCYPGMTVLKRSGTTGLAFTHHELGSDPTKAIPILQEIRALADADHGVTEALSANMPIIETTPTNQTQQRMDLMGQFEGFATDLERGLFTRCIDKSRDLILQYMSDPFSDPNAELILGQEGAELDMMTSDERKALIVTEYNIVARGMSIFFDRLKKINSYTGLYKILGSLPEPALGRIRWETVLDTILTVVGVDNVRDCIKTDEELAADAQAAQQQQAQLMQMELQKTMMPIQGKLQQTQLGIQERMASMQMKLQAELEKTVAKIEAEHQREMVKLQASMEKEMLEQESRTKDRDAKLIQQLMTQKTSEKDREAALLKTMLEQKEAEKDRDAKLMQALMEQKKADEDREAKLLQAVMELKASKEAETNKQLLELYKIIESKKATEKAASPTIKVKVDTNTGKKKATVGKDGSYTVEDVKEKPSKKKVSKTGDNQWIVEEIEDGNG